MILSAPLQFTLPDFLGRSFSMRDRIGLGLALAATVFLAACGADKTPARHVLPTDVVPVHYDIAVRPDAAALTFTGSVTAEVQVVRATSAVTLNAADMTIRRGPAGRR
jgi:hypothetical protein